MLLNVNFPALPPSKVKRVLVTAQGQRDQSMLRVDERVDARGRTYFWVGFKRIFGDPERGTDLHAMAEGCISVTPLHMDLTDLREQQRLSGLLESPLRRSRASGKGAQTRPKKPAQETRRCASAKPPRSSSSGNASGLGFLGPGFGTHCSRTGFSGRVDARCGSRKRDGRVDVAKDRVLGIASAA